MKKGNWTVTLELHDVAALLFTIDADSEAAEELADDELSPPCA